MIKYFDKYFWVSRFLPSILGLIIFLFIYLLVENNNQVFIKLGKHFQEIQFLIKYSVPFVLLLGYSFIVRFIGKYIEKLVFRKNGFPTTYLLMSEKSALPKELLTNYCKKINEDFNLFIPQEFADRKDLILYLNQAARFISKKLYHDERVLNHNITYGFMRNFTGALALNVIILILLFMLLLLGNDSQNLWTICFTIFSHIILILISIYFTIMSAEEYANGILTIYMSEKQM